MDKTKGLEVIDCGVIEYSEAWDRQKHYFNGRLTGASNQDVLLYCEHPHVYTLGKSGDRDNLLISDEFLKSINATYFAIDRGGDITYHGYGQLVGYPIIDVSTYSIGLREYIYKVEEAIIKTIAHYNIKGFRIDSATGVWVNSLKGECKICAIGVKASRYITMHGFALNVSTDLRYFDYINPCGFTTKGVTSIVEEIGDSMVIDTATLMSEVKALFAKYFTEELMG